MRHLLAVPAAVRFLSCEPLLGPLDLGAFLNRADEAAGLHWVIVGGESGARARPMSRRWARRLRDQCRSARVPFFFKQWGGRTPKAGGRELDGVTWDEFPGEDKAKRWIKDQADRGKPAATGQPMSTRVHLVETLVDILA